MRCSSDLLARRLRCNAGCLRPLRQITLIPQEIYVHELSARDGLTRTDGDWSREHRAVVDEGVELAALGTGVHCGGQIVQQSVVEIASDKTRVEHRCVDTGKLG